MLPSDYPLELYHGDSYEWQFKFWLDSAKTQPMDLTDVIAKAEIRDESGGLVIFLLGTTIVLPNTISMTLAADMSEELPLQSMVWDLQLTWPSGAVNTVVAGSVAITADVTDSTIPVLATSQAQPQIIRAPRLVRK